MSNVPPSPASLRGAIDLSPLTAPKPSPRPAGASPLVLDATDASFAEVLELSNSVPVLVEFYGQGVAAELGGIVESYGGRIVLATVDGTRNPQLVQAFKVQQVPTVAAVVAGRPLQLYVGSYPEAEVRDVIEQVLVLAQQNGVTGTVPADADAVAEEPPLPPHHQEAFDAISRGDFAAAVAEYRIALTQNPRDGLATAGLAQASLLLRLDGVVEDEVRAAAASAPDDADAALAVADVDLGAGRVDDAFDRLLGLFATLDAAGKNAVRTRLLEYFEIIGAEDPRVIAARKRLTALLF